MKEVLSNFVEALRQEMQQYGEILARLDNEQTAIASYGPQAILSSITAINAQTQVIEESRRHRLTIQEEIAKRLGCLEQAPLLELLPLLPAPHRLLISALVTENAALLERIRDRAEQNHLNLKRSTELMCHVLGRLDSTTDGAQPRLVGGQGSIAETGPTKTAA